MGTSADKKFYERVIDEITEEQILKLLRDYGTEPYRIKDNEIWFRTVCHNGHSHKLCYFRDSKKKHDAEGARSAMAAHITRSMNNILKSFQAMQPIEYRNSFPES